MPYLLRYDGSNDRVELASQIDIASGDDFSIRTRWPAAANSGNHRILGGASIAATSPRVICFAGGNVTVYGSSGGNVSFSLSIDISVDRELEIRRVSGQMGIYYDGVLQGATQSSTQTFTGFAVFGGNFNTATVASDLYYFEFDINGSPVAAYDPSDSDTSNTGLQPVLLDSVGTNDGTGVNFPTNGSAFISYGGAATQNVDMNLASATPVVYSPEIVASQEIDMTVVSGAASVYDFDVLSEQFVDFEIASGTTTVYLVEVLSGVTEIEMELTSATPSVLSPEILAGVVEVFPELVAGIAEVYELRVEYTQYVDADLTSSEADVYLHQVYIVSEGTGQFLGGFGILQFIYWDA